MNPYDLFLLGKNYLSHHLLGSFLNKDSNDENISTTFRVYAPNAKFVYVLIDNDKYLLNKIHHQGFYETTINKNLEWFSYKYEIHTKNGTVLFKADPFSYFSEVRPLNSSRVYDINNYKYNDDKWFYNKRQVYDKPLLIYELHFGSFMKNYNDFKNYNEMPDILIKYLKDNNFTHVEFMPLYEYPLDDSWGYQGTGFFNVASRYGSPKDLMYLIDRLHQAGIGVIFDWVLGHINKDDFGLHLFDGSYLYENEDEFLRENITWGTANLDFNKGITRSFMLSALTFWMDYFHVDGFRIDAVSHLIYHLGNKDNGLNEGAINFIKELSTHLFKKDDRLIFSAEDSTDYPLVTHPVSSGGLGFNYKWNMGFMNDTLSYFELDPIYRKYHHDKITFSIHYAYNENFILPFSHDEVVHMKGSLLSKMPGSYEQKFANWRLLMMLFITHPGKKLLFMGGEFAQVAEWNFKTELDWHLLSYPIHDANNKYFKDLTNVYLNEKSLYQYDHNPKGFKWLIVDHYDSSVFAYLRASDNDFLVIILNMTPNRYDYYEIGVPYRGKYIEIINSDRDIYSGENHFNKAPLKTYLEPRNNNPYHIKIKLGSLSGLILRYEKE